MTDETPIEEVEVEIVEAEIVQAEEQRRRFGKGASLTYPRCGAQTRAEDKHPCENMAGMRTTHPGQGRCYLHGGLQRGDRRMTHGRYSAESGGIKHPRIADLYERFKDDQDPTNLLDEIGLLRALAINFIEEHQEQTAALLAWYHDRDPIRRPLPPAMMRGFEQAYDLWEAHLVSNGDWSPEREREAEHGKKVLALLRGTEEAAARPRKVSDISDAAALIDTVARTVERLEKMRSASAISEPELSRIINAMSRVVDVLVSDQSVKDKIREGWLGIVTR